jgi:hypothetical protein
MCNRILQRNVIGQYVASAYIRGELQALEIKVTGKYANLKQLKKKVKLSP